MKRSVARDVAVVGLMLFATYLGAGNLIFPPYIGAITGSAWLLPAVGFLITGVGIPMLGLVALSMSGGEPDNLARRSWPLMSNVLNVLILLMIGPLFAIPRTAATTCEMTIMPFLPKTVNSNIVYFIVSCAFFTITFLLTKSSSGGLDKIGSILSPILIIFLLITLILSVVRPIGEPIHRNTVGNLLYFGVLNGYQTMDGLGSVVIGGAGAVYFASIGYKKDQINKMLPKCAVIAGVLMAIVYIGFVWIGASGSAELSQYQSQRTILLSNAMNLLAGSFGKILLAIIIFFACLTTSSGLTISFTEYFYSLFKEKVNKQIISIVCILVSFIISLLGVEGIISLAGPILETIYPIILVLIIVNIFDKFIKEDIVVKGILMGSILIAPILLLKNFEFSSKIAKSIINAIPLGESGFAYVTTSILGGIIAYIILQIKVCRDKK